MGSLWTTREVSVASGLKEWELWRHVRRGTLNPVKLSSHQFAWTQVELEKAQTLAREKGGEIKA